MSKKDDDFGFLTSRSEEESNNELAIAELIKESLDEGRSPQIISQLILKEFKVEWSTKYIAKFIKNKLPFIFPAFDVSGKIPIEYPKKK